MSARQQPHNMHAVTKRSSDGCAAVARWRRINLRSTYTYLSSTKVSIHLCEFIPPHAKARRRLRVALAELIECVVLSSYRVGESAW